MSGWLAQKEQQEIGSIAPLIDLSFGMGMSGLREVLFKGALLQWPVQGLLQPRPTLHTFALVAETFPLFTPLLMLSVGKTPWVNHGQGISLFFGLE